LRHHLNCLNAAAQLHSQKRRGKAGVGTRFVLNGATLISKGNRPKGATETDDRKQTGYDQERNRPSQARKCPSWSTDRRSAALANPKLMQM
jgi:hypothetical protein